MTPDHPQTSGLLDVQFFYGILRGHLKGTQPFRPLFKIDHTVAAAVVDLLVFPADTFVAGNAVPKSVSYSVPALYGAAHLLNGSRERCDQRALYKTEGYVPGRL